MEGRDAGDDRTVHLDPQALRDLRPTRGQALRAAVVGGSLAGAGGAIWTWARAGSSVAAPSPRRDVEILNFLLLLEYVQSGFYEDALRRARLSGDLLEYARTVAPQEREHVDFLRKRLGRRARAAPKLEFGAAASNSEQFRATALELEETAAAAYIGQEPNLSRDAIGDGARIVSVEARHAAWIRDLAGENPAPRAADPAKTADETMEALRRRGFVR